MVLRKGGAAMKQILQLLTQPVFLVSDRVVTWRNHAAGTLVDEGTPLVYLLEDHGELFQQWDGQGKLQTTLVLSGQRYDAVACTTGEGIVFVVSSDEAQWETKASAMLHASATLRKPLQNMVAVTDTVLHLIDHTEEGLKASAALNRSLYQMLRLCGQMADGGRLLLQRLECRKESTDLNAFLTEFAEKLAPMLQCSGWSFHFVPSQTRIRADVDRALIERALYNLVSNSLHFTPKGGTLMLRASRNAKLAFLSLSDSGEGLRPEKIAGLLERTSEPVNTDPRNGMGLGLQMVREIARLHGGTMMLGTNSDGRGTSVSFSLSMEHSTIVLRSQNVSYDYCGGFDHALVELADVLDAEYFDPREV